MPPPPFSLEPLYIKCFFSVSPTSLEIQTRLSLQRAAQDAAGRSGSKRPHGPALMARVRAAAGALWGLNHWSQVYRWGSGVYAARHRCVELNLLMKSEDAAELFPEVSAGRQATNT